MNLKNDIAQMPEQLVAQLGVTSLVYIRAVNDPNSKGFAIYAADGTQLAVLPNYEAAYYTARQHDLDPVMVH